MSRPVIVWFRLDLRLDDNPALRAAVDSGKPVVPLYIWDPGAEGDWAPGAASRWWLHQSLKALDGELQRRGSRLIIRQGPSVAVLDEVLEETGAETLYCNRRYERLVVQRDSEIKNHLQAVDVEVLSSNGSLLYEPWNVSTKSETPFKVFTPFWKACQALPEPDKPLPAPRKLSSFGNGLPSEAVDSLELEPEVDWAAGIRKAWKPGAAGAARQLKRFSGEPLLAYSSDRDRPDRRGTSRLSPHLHFGELGPRRVWHAVRDCAAEASAEGRKGALKAAEVYVRELGWREFAYHLLFHFPETADSPLRPAFEKFPWRKDDRALKAWQRGRTGYPIVDAGMRQLWETGWMHNRARMIVASFLVKDLLISWREGARWFWDTLVDADLANNTLGWQWSAGCGADAAPYFRIFNPVTQGKKFDPDGHYVRRWVPELAKIDTKWIHDPWAAPRNVLQSCGIKLGETYPAPIVDHSAARKQALEAFELIKGL